MWDTHPPIAERIGILERIAGQMGQPFPPGLDVANPQASPQPPG
jgi:hypothetical protein